MAQKADSLQAEINCLRNEIFKRDLALGDYDCQYKQLMVSNIYIDYSNCGRAKRCSRVKLFEIWDEIVFLN